MTVALIVTLLLACCQKGLSLLEEEKTSAGDILHRLELLEQQNNLQSQQIDTQQQHITDLINEIHTIKTQYLTDVHNLQSDNTNLQMQIEQLQQSNSDVSFFAYLQQNVVNPPHGQTIVFDSMMTNSGNDYDPVHGVFTAPANGTYFLSLSASLAPQAIHDHLLHLYITVNGSKHVAYVFLDHNQSFWLERSATAIVHLKEGDRAWVMSLFGQGTLGGYDGSEDKIHSYFSGFLVHGD